MSSYTASQEAVQANRLDVTPFLSARENGFTADRIAVQITAAAAGGNKGRLGIYADDGTLNPGALELDREIDIDGVGIKSAIIDHSLTKGIHWLAILCQAQITIYKGTMYAWTLPILGVVSTSFNQQKQVWQTAQAYGALPDPHPAVGSVGSHAIGVYLRVKSLD